jgi:hypothetical protein
MLLGLLKYRWIILAAGIFLAGWSVNGWRLNGKIEGLKADHAEQEAKAAQLYALGVEALRKREQELTERVNDAETKRLADAKKQAAIAYGLRSERDSLRGSITAYAEAYGTAENSASSSRDRAIALGNLLQEALRSSEEGAIDGERCEGNVRSLLDAWPK